MTWLIWGCKWKKYQTVDGVTLSAGDWKNFEASIIWKAFLFEVEERRVFLLELLVNGSPLWTEDQIRGRIQELEFFRNIPALVRAAINDRSDDNNNNNTSE